MKNKDKQIVENFIRKVIDGDTTVQDSINNIINNIQNEDMCFNNIKKYIGLEYNIIGFGEGRICFDYSKNRILKIAYNSIGLKKCKNEIDIWSLNNKEINKFLFKIYHSGEGWIVSEKFNEMIHIEDMTSEIVEIGYNLCKEMQLSNIKHSNIVRFDNPETVYADNVARSFKDNKIKFFDFGYCYIKK